MSDVPGPDDGDLMHGLEAVGHAEDMSSSSSRLPFDPRYYGPGDAYADLKDWIHRYRIYVFAALAGAVFVWVRYDLGADLPPWMDILLPAGGIALVFGWGAGKRLGEWFARPRYKVVAQLDAKTGDLDLLKISLERWRSMRVLDHEGEEQPRSYLKDIVVNGERAIEVDRYYPQHNAAIASWQAGASNSDLREWERKVDRVKTDLEKEASEAIEAKVNADERARKQARETSNFVLGVVEGVLEPGEGNLADRLEVIEEREDAESHEEVLSGLESKVLSNGHGEPEEDSEDSHDPTEEVLGRIESITSSLDPRSNGGKSDE